jgi:predicted Rossmann fold nucleotide-binding protein DprA/Smf involved in DNA uptake
MKLAILGSRNFNDKDKVLSKLNEMFLIPYTHNALELEIISGGAVGVDTWAVEWGKGLSKNIPITIIRPINPADKISYLFRNVEIITLADKIVVFWNAESRGSKFVIDYAKARGKNIEVIMEK